MQDPASGQARRRGPRVRWMVVGAAAAILVLVGAGAAWLSLRSEEAGPAVTVTLADGTPASEVTVATVADEPPAGLLAATEGPVTQQFDITSQRPSTAPLELGLPLSEDLSAEQRQHLLVAYQERAGGGWLVEHAEADGGALTVSTDHLSRWQGFVERVQGTPAAAKAAVAGGYDWVAKFVGARADGACAGADTSLYEADIVAPGAGDSPPVLACPEPVGDDGRPRLRLANQRGIAMDVALPEGARIEAVSSAALTERLWGGVYETLGGEGAEIAWLPGGGTMVVSFQEVPGAISLTANNSAFATDAVIAAAAKGRLGGSDLKNAGLLAELASCSYQAVGTGANGDAGDDAWAYARDAWVECGGAISDATPHGGIGQVLAGTPEFLFALPKTALAGLDSLRAIRDGQQTITFRTRSGASFQAPSEGYAARFDLQWGNSDPGDTVAAVVEITALRPLQEAIDEGFAPSCFEGDVRAAAHIGGYIEMTSIHAEDFSTRIAPVLTPMKFRVQDGPFSHEEIYRELDTDSALGWDPADEAAVLESEGECAGDQSSYPMMALGTYTLDEGQRTERIPFDLIYPKVYSQSQPDGDTERLEKVGITVNPRITFYPLSNGLECISGPGAGLRDLIPLTGADSIALGREYEIDVARFKKPPCAGESAPSSESGAADAPPPDDEPANDPEAVPGPLEIDEDEASAENDRIFLAIKAGDYSVLPAAEDLMGRLDGSSSPQLGNAAFNVGFLRYQTGDCAGAESAFAVAASIDGTDAQNLNRDRALDYARDGCTADLGALIG